MKSFSKSFVSWFKTRSAILNETEDLISNIQNRNFGNILVILGPLASEGSYCPELVHLERLVAGHGTSSVSNELSFDSK